jgi:hypothetical protein
MEHESHFLVLPDGKTIIGACKHNLFMEDISRNDNTAYRQIANHGNIIFFVFYNLVSKTLFVGDRYGKVVEYLREDNTQSWVKVKDYGKMGNEVFLSVDQIGDVLVFGGSNYSIRAIDSLKKTLLPGSLKTAFEHVDSLRFCKLPENKIYLSVCGRHPKYSNDQTDIYDATDLARAFGYNFQETVRDTPRSVSSEEPIVEVDSKDTQTETSTFCGCTSKKVIDTILSKMSYYLQDFRNVINSDFEKKIKRILSNYPLFCNEQKPQMKKSTRINSKRNSSAS